MAPHVDSMIAVLVVVMLLQSCRTGQVTADELMSAIVAHLVLCMAAYGPEFFRPKHHYALHLPDMLRRFGCLLSTFVQERKHRLVTRYGRDRRSRKSFETGVIEDITCHQLWELQQRFYFATHVAKPTKRMTSYLAEIFPGIDASDFQLVSNISLNGGRANKGDVVAFFANGEMEVGELIVSVAADDAIFCFVAKWQKIEFEGFWLTCRVSDNDLCKIPWK